MKPLTKGQRRLAGTASLLLAGSVTLAGAPSAGAAGDYLQLSQDGNRFGSALPGPVFTASVAYVPGAAQTATVWVRNNSAERARLSSAAVMVRSDPELNGYLGLAAASRFAPTGRTALGLQGSCADLPSTWSLAGGEEMALTFTVDLSVDAPNATRNRTAAFDLLFYLESTDAGPAPRAACSVLDNGDDDGGGDGGGTGTDGNTDTVPGSIPGGTAPGETEVDALPGARSTRVQNPATGTLVSLPGTGTADENGTGAAGQTVTAGAITEQPAGVPAASSPLEQEPPVLEARFQSTVEPVIRSLSGTLLIAMSVAFTAAMVFRVWSRRYE